MAKKPFPQRQPAPPSRPDVETPPPEPVHDSQTPPADDPRITPVPPSGPLTEPSEALPEPPVPHQDPPEELSAPMDQPLEGEKEVHDPVAGHLADRPDHLEDQARKHLRALQGHKLTVSEFRDALHLSDDAKSHLDNYVAQGLVQRQWIAGAGQYALTAAGQDYLNRSA